MQTDSFLIPSECVCVWWRFFSFVCVGCFHPHMHADSKVLEHIRRKVKYLCPFFLGLAVHSSISDFSIESKDNWNGLSIWNWFSINIASSGINMNMGPMGWATQTI